jgi:hypothetical protein
MSDSEQDPAEYGRRLAEEAARRFDPVSHAQSGAAIALFGNLYRLLIEKQVVTQAEAVARLERLSNEIMSAPVTDDTRGLAVALIDIVRNGVAGEGEPTKS